MSDSFLQKPIGTIGLIGSAILGPYFYFGDVEAPKPANVPSLEGSVDTFGYSNGYPNSVPGLGEYGASVGTPVYSVAGNNASPIWTNAPASDFREFLRFDITPAWVPEHFPRVTTVTGDTRWTALRVPLMSGTRTTDLAGSLTYYFDSQPTVCRIQFQGVTGDPSSLVALMLQYYHLEAEPSLSGQFFTSRWNNRVTSVLHITPAPVIYSQDTHKRYQVFLELNQPSTNYALTREADELVRSFSHRP